MSIVFVYTQLNFKTVLFRTIQFSVVQFQCHKQFYLKQFSLTCVRSLHVKTVLFQAIQFLSNIFFGIITVKNSFYTIFIELSSQNLFFRQWVTIEISWEQFFKKSKLLQRNIPYLIIYLPGFCRWSNCKCHTPVLDFGPERGPGKGTMADLGPLIRHLVSTRLPSGGRAAFLSPLSPLYGTRPCV